MNKLRRFLNSNFFAVMVLIVALGIVISLPIITRLEVINASLSPPRPRQLSVPDGWWKQYKGR